jgi:xylulokinase
VYNLRHPDGAGLILIGAPATAAGNLDWLRSALFPGMDAAEAFEILNAEAEAASPASLLYLPWLSGERSPFKDPEARAAFVGMGRETTRGDLARAVLEGVAFSLKSVHDAIYETDKATPLPAAATLVGGGARSALWGRILASVLGCPMLVPENPADAGARGAAVLAGRALGWYGDFALSGGLVAAARREPEPDWSRAYGALYPAYAAMHDPLKSAFSAMASMRSRA